MVPAPTTDPAEPGDPRPTVVAAVLALDGVDVSDTVAAVTGQVYEVARIVVIGGEAEGLDSAPTLRRFIATLGPDTDLVWVVHGDARPRPDALGALVAELERNEASVVGSKVLRADRAELLESVGAATDVYGEPYTGLDEDEMDLQQYDVVRDVAFVLGVSMLVRRDLLRGLKGPDELLAPTAAGIDFSQRARIAGGRVMVAPSSEVLHEGRCREGVAPWREQAGRMRAMLKAYRLVTLAWVVPVGFLLYLADAIFQLALGRPRPLGQLIAATLWNVVYLPSTLAARRSLAPLRMVGDEELFRYQVSGSVRWRERADEIDERFGSIIDEEAEAGLAEPAAATARGPLAAALLALLFVGLAARAVWFGRLPAVGFSLPFPVDPAAVLASYAGGWNPTGLGSPEPIHPAAALAALAKFLLAGWDGAEAVLTAGAMLLGMFGTARLLGRFGIGPAARYAGAVVAVLGPFVAAAGEAAYWPAVVGMSGLPWALDAVFRSWPTGWRSRLRRVSVMVLAMAPAAALVPLATTVPVVVALAGVVAGRRRWAALGRSLIPVMAGTVFVGVYLLGVGPSVLLGGGGPADLALVSPVWLAVLAVAAVLAVIRGGQGGDLAGWGALLVGFALVGDRVPGTGTEVAAAAVLVASLGAAMVVAGAFGGGLVGGWRRPVQVVAAAAALAALAPVATAIPAGRVYLPSDVWSDRLAFATALAPPSGPDRVLLVASGEVLPGAVREGDGFVYRLVDGEGPRLDEAWLPTERAGDRALDETLAEVVLAEGVRPGAALAPFAIRWIVVLGDTPFTEALANQVDLAPIPLGPGIAVYRNEAAMPRAAASDGSAWTWTYAAASGPASEGARVRIADNADRRWRPDWVRDGWANSVSARTGEVWFATDPAARAAGWAAVGLALAALAGVAVPQQAGTSRIVEAEGEAETSEEVKV